MADQRIFFEQGSDETGDSGERGDNAAGGVASIKPYIAGERAGEDIFNRPSENMRKRTEVLRTAGEETKYLLDSDMRWIISAGNADGLSPGPLTMPGISTWNASTGKFTTSASSVVQPINTPSSDLQETKTYSFTDGLSQTATIAFKPLSTATPTVAGEQKRAYNGANLLKIIWKAVPEVELASATVPNYCNAAITGDPEHILTISIRDDNTTQMSNVATALADLETVAGVLGSIGLGYIVAGTVATSLLISEVPVLERDYRMTNTFEREVHYIPAANFATFFAVPNSLADGDTLAISFADYVTESSVQMTGRRESVPSNNTTAHSGTTTVSAGELFITSTAEDVHKIPLAIPLCKRIGDDLYWMDGTVVTGTQVTLPVYFGENGATVDRVAAMLAADSDVTGHWLFNDIISVGTTRAVTASNSYAIYATRATTAPVSSLYGMHLTTTASQTVAAELTGIHNRVAVNAAVTTEVTGLFSSLVVSADPGNSAIGVFGGVRLSSTAGETPGLAFSLAMEFASENTTALTKATLAGGMYNALTLAGGEFTTMYGYGLVVGESLLGTNPSDITNFRGYSAEITMPASTTVGSVSASYTELTTLAASSVTGNYLQIVASGATSNNVVGSYVNITTSSTAVEVKGDYTRLVVNGGVSYAMGRDVYLETNAAVGGTTYGDKTSVRIEADPGTDVGADFSKLDIRDTGGETPDVAFAYLGEITTSGDATDTKAALAGGMYISGVLDGGAFPEFAGARVELPGGAAATAATVTDYIGLKSIVTTRTNVTTTNAYGAYILLNCRSAAAVTESIGLRVYTDSVDMGASITAVDGGSGSSALHVEPQGTTMYGLYVSASGKQSNFEGAAYFGGGTVPASSMDINMSGGFKTVYQDIPGATSIAATNKSLIRLTGTTSAVATITGSQLGQWLILVNTGSGNVTIAYSAAPTVNTIVTATAADVILFPGTSIMLVKLATQWHEVAHT